MSTTHGRQHIPFCWDFDGENIVIKNDRGLSHRYSINEILKIMHKLRGNFQDNWIPLANNVEKMFNGTEREGLGSTIYSLTHNLSHAQGASYLGVILEEIGILKWNGQSKNIEWCIVVDKEIDKSSLKDFIREKTSRLDSKSTRINIVDTTTYTIDDHKHRFAVWTGARAVQRGFTTVKNIRNVIEACNLRRAITDVYRPDLNAKEYDTWHKNICKNIIAEFDKIHVTNATYGRAAKIVAIYIKTTVVIGGYHLSALARVAHPPIDSILLKNISKSHTSLEGITMKPWTKLDEEDYFDLLAKLRGVLSTHEPLWRIEKYWTITSL